MIRFRHAALALVALASLATAQTVPITSLPSATTLSGTEPIPGVQSGHTVKLTPNQIVALAGATLQPKDAQLDALAALSPSANQCVYWTASTNAGLYSCTSFSRGLLNGADATAWRSALGVTGSGADTTYAFRANNLSDLASASTARTNLGLGTLATQSGTFSGTSSGTNTGDQTTITGNAGTATALATGRTIAITGDLAYTSPSFTGAANVTAAGTLATVNSNVGTFGGSTSIPSVTVNGKGLVTAASATALTAATLSSSWVPCKSAVAVPLTGTTTETTLATCSLAGNTLGPNGQVEIIALFSVTNNANVKTPRFKFGSMTFQSSSISSNGQQQIMGRIANRNATNSQVAFTGSGTGLGSGGTAAAGTSAIDTTANVDITITGQLANSADTLTLESYLIRVTYGS